MGGGHGYSKARKCIALRRFAFRESPTQRHGLTYCRACGYRVSLHEEILRQDMAEAERPGTGR
jgi:hypothetical protein